MNNLENSRIAVCLTGQPRFFKECSQSILKYFSTEKNNSYYFFGHTWLSNHYKIKLNNKTVWKSEKNIDHDTLKSDLKNHYPFQSLFIEDCPFADSMTSSLNSSAKCNFLKQKYEAENNMMFDLVIHMRFDLCFRPGLRFEDIVMEKPEEKRLYSYYGFMNGEFYLPNPDAVIYYGTSLTMDLLETFYHIYSNKKYKEFYKCNQDNTYIDKLAPGTALYKWAMEKNILPTHVLLPYSILRYESRNLDMSVDWSKIEEISRKTY